MKSNSSITRLLSLAGPALSRASIPLEADLALGLAAVAPLLRRRNGFYAFESALHVFPLGTPIDENERDVSAWNSPTLWRDRYESLASGCLFFAEDLFGEQFAVCDGEIVRFHPETGEMRTHARDIDAWAEKILARYEFETGLNLAREWQRRHRPLVPGERLHPITPFVLNGAFSVENLRAGDAVDGMRFRADLAHQVRSLPDGASVRFVVTE